MREARKPVEKCFDVRSRGDGIASAGWCRGHQWIPGPEMNMRRFAAALLLATIACWGAPAAAKTSSASTLLRVVADIPLPGPASRFDYQSLDPGRHLLFIAHLAAGTVVAFDTSERRVVGEVQGIRQAHGVLAVPGLERVYAAATGTNEIAVIDEKSLKVITRIPGGVYPDGMAYASQAHKLYVSNQAGRTETVIDVRTNRRIATIALDGEAGNSQYDSVTQHIFVNVQTRNELVEIDTRTDAIVGRYPVPGAQHNHGLLIDSERRLAYIACEGNHRLIVFDLSALKVMASYPTGEGPDVLAFDESLKLLYVASESGVLALFGSDGRSLRELARWKFAPRAHSVAVDSEMHEAYFPLENINGRPILRITRPLDTTQK
jgi:YVTN family beta-propeller protein